MRGDDSHPGPRRRALLQAACGMALAGPAGWAGAMAGNREPLYVSCRQRAMAGADRQRMLDEVAVIDAAGREHLSLPLPQRGHSFAIDAARQRAVVFGRQPGFFAQAFALPGAGDSAPPQPIVPAENRHFFGHGVFSPDGRLLLATENDYENGRAVVGIYDASRGGRYRRIGEWDSGGIGAHEAVVLPDGRTLCVANGGLLTHPDYDKTPLNLADMCPSLAYIDLRHGDLIEQVELPRQWHQLSIRHLVVAGSGEVWFGCQHMGPASERPPLVGCHRRGQVPRLLAGQPDTLARLRNYVGSLAIDASGDILATSSPVGGLTVFWDTRTGRELDWRALPDGCGVAGLRSRPGHFLRSSGLGRLDEVEAGGAAAVPVMEQQTVAWDNHLRAIG